MSFLKANGIRGLVGKNDWPRCTEEEPEIYAKKELDTLFTKCDAEERLWYEFFLASYGPKSVLVLDEAVSKHGSEAADRLVMTSAEQCSDLDQETARICACIPTE